MRKEIVKSDKLTKLKTAFTLVELIITIIILAILATIGFISFMGYTSQARDVVRMQDLQDIQKTIVLYQAKNGKFPEVENAKEVEIEGVKWKVGTFGKKAVEELQDISSLPLDPSTSSGYFYMTSESGLSYKLEAKLENNLKNNPNKGDKKLFVLTNYKKSLVSNTSGGGNPENILGTNITNGIEYTLSYVDGPNSWNKTDTNCEFPDLKINYTEGGIQKTQVWAGCNSTLGTGSGVYDYDNNPQNSIAKDDDFNTIYGKLYTYTGAINKACKNGWHIPNSNEWNTLIKSIGCGNFTWNGLLQCPSIGYKNHFNEPTLKNISNILKIPLSGYKYITYEFRDIKNLTFLWNSDNVNIGNLYILLYKNINTIQLYMTNENSSFSARCIK